MKHYFMYANSTKLGILCAFNINIRLLFQNKKIIGSNQQNYLEMSADHLFPPCSETAF